MANDNTHGNDGPDDASMINPFGITDSELDNLEIPPSDTEGTSSFMGNITSGSDGMNFENDQVSAKSIKVGIIKY